MSAVFTATFTELTNGQENPHGTMQNVTANPNMSHDINGDTPGTRADNYGPHGTYENYLENNDSYGMYDFDPDYAEDVYLVTVYIAIPVGVLGILGNILILIIMSSPPFNTIPQSVLLNALAAVDLIKNVTNLIFAVAEVAFGIYIPVENRAMCKFDILLVTAQLDAWYIVSLTIERVICVFRPIETAQIITKKRAWVVSITFAVFFFLWNLETAFRYDLVPEYGFNHCLEVTDYGLPQLIKAKDSISELLTSFIPICIMIPANITIFVKLYLRVQAQKQLGVINQNENKLVQMTLMLATVTITFIVLVSPLSFYMMVIGFRFGDPLLDIFICLEGFNPACNILLYFMTGKMFRDKVVALFCSCTCLRGGEQTATPMRMGVGSGSGQTKQTSAKSQST